MSNNQSTLLSMANATMSSMQAALNRAEEFMENASFAEAEGQLKLYDVLSTSMERTMKRIDDLVPSGGDALIA